MGGREEKREAHVGTVLSDLAEGGPWQGIFSLFLNLSLRHACGHVTADTLGAESRKVSWMVEWQGGADGTYGDSLLPMGTLCGLTPVPGSWVQPEVPS